MLIDVKSRRGSRSGVGNGNGVPSWIALRFDCAYQPEAQASAFRREPPLPPIRSGFTHPRILDKLISPPIARASTIGLCSWLTGLMIAITSRRARTTPRNRIASYDVDSRSNARARREDHSHETGAGCEDVMAGSVRVRRSARQPHRPGRAGIWDTFHFPKEHVLKSIIIKI